MTQLALTLNKPNAKKIFPYQWGRTNGLWYCLVKKLIDIYSYGPSFAHLPITLISVRPWNWFNGSINKSITCPFSPHGQYCLYRSYRGAILKAFLCFPVAHELHVCSELGCLYIIYFSQCYYMLLHSCLP